MFTVIKGITFILVIAFIFEMIKGDNRDVFLAEMKYSPVKSIIIALIVIWIILA